MKLEPIEPPKWARPKGYANGILVSGAGKLLFVAGQVGWDHEQKLVPGGFGAQFAQALRNVVAVVDAARGHPDHIVRMTVYVTDKRLYLAATKEIGASWKEIVGRHWPAMSLVQVADLLEEDALVEIEATAALP
jgi:enamine deaminase RidA (YjgF/YER057c/UK114 family)